MRLPRRPHGGCPAPLPRLLDLSALTRSNQGARSSVRDVVCGFAELAPRHGVGFTRQAHPSGAATEARRARHEPSRLSRSWTSSRTGIRRVLSVRGIRDAARAGHRAGLHRPPLHRRRSLRGADGGGDGCDTAGALGVRPRSADGRSLQAGRTRGCAGVARTAQATTPVGRPGRRTDPGELTGRDHRPDGCRPPVCAHSSTGPWTESRPAPRAPSRTSTTHWPPGWAWNDRTTG